MTEVVRPSWNILESLVENAESKLFICSPWIATHGVERIKSYLSSKDLKSGFREIEFWCRLADCNTDSAALLSFANQCNEKGISTVFKDSAALHAKIYLADQRQVLLTSANLSFQGFEQNLELGLLTDDSLVIRQTLEILEAMSCSMQLVTIEQLTYFVQRQRPQVLANQPVTSGNEDVVPIWLQQPKRKDTYDPLPLPSLAELISRHEPLVGGYDLLEYREHLLAQLDLSAPHIEGLNPDFYVGKRVRVWFLSPNDLEIGIVFHHGNPVQSVTGIFEGPQAELFAAESYSSPNGTSVSVSDQSKPASNNRN
jgi:hypothetical protein